MGVRTPWRRHSCQRSPSPGLARTRRSVWVPAARVAGGAGRAARLGAGLLGARVRVVGGQHHAARVLHLHRQPRMAPLRPENKGGDQAGPPPRPVTRAEARPVLRTGPAPAAVRSARGGGPARGRPSPRPEDTPTGAGGGEPGEEWGSGWGESGRLGGLGKNRGREGCGGGGP